ncbi:hypothetical protein ACF1AO_34715 [Streptomyces longwoodensis]|uniref:hypothetical protein n=1 Tax=Streptomyces longwoodensis TaxID=68231 RepID=UPI0036FB85C4
MRHRVQQQPPKPWPEDIVDYFGDSGSGGGQGHMAFHFPVMPHIFMAVRRETRR